MQGLRCLRRTAIVFATLVLSPLATLVLLPAAHAAGPMDKREVEARADFAAGRYQKAVDTFAQLFADTADPVYLRNIGRCYQKLQRPREAIDSFQEYLHKGKSLSKSERKEIDGYIAEMKALQAAETPATPPSPPPPPVTMSPAPTPAAPAPIAPLATGPGAGEGTSPPAVGPPGAALVATPAPTPAPSTPPDRGGGQTWRIAGIAAAAGGAACIAAGIVFGAAASADADAIGKKYDAATESAGKRDVTLQWIGYGVGAAALVTGALLYMHGLEPAEASHARGPAGLHAIATVDRAGAGLRIEGAF